jgi:hypothetical protein
MESIEIINKRLFDNFGRGVSELPKYRIVWADSQKEIITAVFEKHTEAGIYLGRELATREVPKYPMYSGFWLLEFVMPNDFNPELKAATSYECIWRFKDRNNNPLPPDWEVIEKIIYFHQHRVAPPTQRELNNTEEEKKQAESAEFLDYLRHDKIMPNRMYDTPLVTVPSNFERSK